MVQHAFGTIENQVTGEKEFLVPKDPGQEEMIKKALRRASKELILYGINLNPEDYKLYTTAVFYCDAAFKQLNTKYTHVGVPTISIGDYITVTISNRAAKSDAAEKSGNLNAIVALGPKGEEYVANFADEYNLPKADEVTRKEIELPDDVSEIASLQNVVQKLLVPYKLKFDTHTFEMYTCVLVFIKACIFAVVDTTLREGSAVINVGDIFYINGAIDSSTLEIVITGKPGADGKLEIKSDACTEGEE